MRGMVLSQVLQNTTHLIVFGNDLGKEGEDTPNASRVILALCYIIQSCPFIIQLLKSSDLYYHLKSSEIYLSIKAYAFKAGPF